MAGVETAPAGTTTNEDNAFTMRLDEALTSGNDVTQAVVVVEADETVQDGVQVESVDDTASVTEVEVDIREPDAGDSRSKMEERARPSLGGSSAMTLLFTSLPTRLVAVQNGF